MDRSYRPAFAPVTVLAVPVTVPVRSVPGVNPEECVDTPPPAGLRAQTTAEEDCCIEIDP